jgi:hypothetical protein
MRPRDPVPAFLFHGAIAFVACAAGSVIGALLQSDGTMNLLLLALPVVIVAGTAGLVANRWSQSRTASWVWVPCGILVAWLLIGESTGWTNRTRPEGIPVYVWNQFLGSRCGETECIDEVLGTAPFLGAVAYSLAARSALLAGGKKGSAGLPR